MEGGRVQKADIVLCLLFISFFGLTSQITANSNAWREKKCFWLEFWKGRYLYPHPLILILGVHSTGVTPELERCWKEWDQSSNISQAWWISMFKPMVCLCLLSGSWAGLQYSEGLEIRLWWCSPNGLALARLPGCTSWLKRWYHSWLGVDAWGLMIKVAEYRYSNNDGKKNILLFIVVTINHYSILSVLSLFMFWITCWYLSNLSPNPCQTSTFVFSDYNRVRLEQVLEG